MKGYLDAKELESYKKEDLQELAKQLGVDAEGTKRKRRQLKPRKKRK